MPDFNALLSKKTGSALKPLTLPAGLYAGQIVGQPEYKESSQKKTPFVRLQVKMLGWPDNIPEDQRGQVDEAGVFHPTDLSKRTLRADYYLTEDAEYRLQDLMKSCNIAMNRSYAETIPELIGQTVMAEVTQRLNEQSGEIFAEIKSLKGQG